MVNDYSSADSYGEPLWVASEKEHAEWQKTFLDYAVALARPGYGADGKTGALIVFGTGTLVQPAGWKAAYILTAAHILPEKGESLYIVDDARCPLQLDLPIFIDAKRDFALFAATELLPQLPGKAVVALEPWPRDPVDRKMKVGVVGFLRDTVVQDAGPLEKRVKLHSYSGTVDDLEENGFKALTISGKPYAAAIPLTEAVGMSGGPVFEIGIDGNASIRGVHYASFVSGEEGHIIANDLFFAPTAEPSKDGAASDEN